MTGFVRRAILLGVAGLFVASAAMANVPDPSKSTCCVSNPNKNFVKVVGYEAGVPDNDAPTAAGNNNVGARCCVEVRDFNNNIIVGIRVEIDFTDCCDISLCTPQTDLVTCSPQIISGFTGPDGRYCYTATGSARDNGSYVIPNPPPGAYGNADPAPGVGCVQTRAGTVVLCNQVAISNDQDGGNLAGLNTGCDFTDFSNLLALVRSNPPVSAFGDKYRGRGDYSADRNIDFFDFSFILAQIRRVNNIPVPDPNGSSTQGCNDVGAAYCNGFGPPAGCP